MPPCVTRTASPRDLLPRAPAGTHALWRVGARHDGDHDGGHDGGHDGDHDGRHDVGDAVGRHASYGWCPREPSGTLGSIERCGAALGSQSPRRSAVTSVGPLYQCSLARVARTSPRRPRNRIPIRRSRREQQSSSWRQRARQRTHWPNTRNGVRRGVRTHGRYHLHCALGTVAGDAS